MKPEKKALTPKDDIEAIEIELERNSSRERRRSVGSA